MPIDFETCYRAFATRDRRFDGRFVTAVTTTGIYCRPGCPARLPARGNVRFYSCAAAAEAEGFRACYRCRPDAMPGSATWLGTSATVARALRLIEEGALEHGGVETLASRLGVTGRWLRRLFEEQLGASPLAVDLTRRVHFARRLLETTALPMEDVALASGFGSARRLHAAVSRTFKRPPRELRGTKAPHETLELRIPVRPPHDLSAVFAFLASRAIAGVESAGPGFYRRTFRMNDTAGTLEARYERGDRWLTLRVPELPARVLPQVVARVSRVFDLAADPAAIAAHLRRDPRLRDAVPVHGVRVPGAWDPFEIGVRALLGQQISVAAARTIAGRLVAAFGEPLSAASGYPAIAPVGSESLPLAADAERPDSSFARAGKPVSRPGGSLAAASANAEVRRGRTQVHPGRPLTTPALAAGVHMRPSPPTVFVFPTADVIADADLSGFGLTGARIRALKTFAAAVADGSLALDGTAGLDDVIARLTALPGIGDWTAQYIAMRGLGEPDAFPAGDLGVRKALASSGALPSERETLVAAESWRPWRGYAVIALWTRPSSQSPRSQSRPRKESS